MATVNLYFGAGGTAGGAATSFATRTSSLTQLKSVMLASVTAADDVVLWGEGLICRETHSSWAAVSGNVLGITAVECVGKSLTIKSYSTVDSGQTPLSLCDFYLYGTSTANWTDTGTTTTKGTKIWVSAGLTGMANGVGRVWAANYKTDPNFTAKELWEGGNNYSATLGAAIHQNLDVIPGVDGVGVQGNCWTCYNSSGVIGTTLYVACAVNPYTAFGQITIYTRGSTSIMNLNGLAAVTVDPEVTLMGGGAYGLYVNGCGSAAECHLEPAIHYSHPYGNPVAVTGASRNLYFAPSIDPQYDAILPYYPGSGTAHDSGSNQFNILAAANFSAATGWPENGGIPGLVVKYKAGNGRVTRIVDLHHGGIVSSPPTTPGTHQFFRIEDGVEFDFTHVRYGRAFAFINAVNVDVGAINVTSQRSFSQFTTIANSRNRIRGARFKSAPNVGNQSSTGTPWGAGGNKRGTSGAFAAFSQTGYATGELLLEDLVIECQDGGGTLSVFDGVAWGGKMRYMNCVFIRTAMPRSETNNVNPLDGILANIVTTTPAALPDQIEFVNCVAVGFGASPVRYFSTSPPVDAVQSIDAMTVGINTGWTKFATYDDFRQALSSGQLPHIKA